MAIPTSGVTPSTAYSPTSTWNTTISLIGDSENLIGENGDGETAILGRPVKELAQNAKYNYDLFTHADISTNIYMPGADTDFESIIALYRNKCLRYKLTLTLQENLTLNAAYDDYFDFSNIMGMDEIEINLNNKSITVAAGYSAKTNLFHFYKCNIPHIYLRNGSIIDNTDNLDYLIKIEKCTGIAQLYDLALTATVSASSANHIGFFYSRGKVDNCTLTAGLNGIVASFLSHVYSKDVSTLTTDCHNYGLMSTSGSIIRKYGVIQPAGTAGAESESTGGTID
jgi:hypothetical protein